MKKTLMLAALLLSSATPALASSSQNCINCPWNQTQGSSTYRPQPTPNSQADRDYRSQNLNSQYNQIQPQPGYRPYATDRDSGSSNSYGRPTPDTGYSRFDRD